MDFGISQEGCFDRTIIVQRAVPASRTGNTALPCRMSPTFSFCLAKKKTCPSRTAYQIWKSPTGCAIPESQISAPPHLGEWHLSGCKEDTLCFSFRCRSPRPTPGGVSKGEGPCPRPSSPVPLGGVSKGEGPQSHPFVPRGGMGDGWRPPCFGWGSKGEGPLRQRPLPLAP